MGLSDVLFDAEYQIKEYLNDQDFGPKGDLREIIKQLVYILESVRELPGLDSHPREQGAATMRECLHKNLRERGIVDLFSKGTLPEFPNDEDFDYPEAYANAAIETARSFVKETPEYWACDSNASIMMRYMKSQHLDPCNRAHYTLAFEKLSAAQKLYRYPVVAPTGRKIQ